MQHQSQPTLPARTSASLAILACLLWGSAFPAVKVGLEHMPPLTFAGIRFILAGALLVPFWVGRENAIAAIRRNWRLIVKVAFLQTVILYGLFFWGLSLVGGAQGAIILGSSPLAMAVMAHWMMKDDRMSMGKTGAIALGLVGVVIVVLGRSANGQAGKNQLLGMALLAVTVISSGLASIAVVTPGSWS